MKNLSYILLQLKCTLRCGIKTRVFVIMTFVMLLIMSIVYSITVTVNDAVDTNIVGDAKNREFAVSLIHDTEMNISEFSNKLSGIKHINTIRNYYNDINLTLINKKISKQQLDVTLTSGTNEHLPEIIKGSAIDENDSNKVVLPDSFTVILGEKDIDVNANDYLGETFDFYYIDYNGKQVKYSAQVVGIYNSKDTDYFFIPLSDLYDILKASGETQESASFRIVTDTYKNYEATIEQVESVFGEENIDIVKYVLNTRVYDMFLKLTDICFVVFGVICIGLFFIQNILVSNLFNEKEKEISISRAIGYNKSQIVGSMLVQSIALDIIVIILNTVASYFIVEYVGGILMKLLSNYDYLKLRISCEPISLLITSGVLIVLTVAICVLNVLIKLRKKPTELIKQNQSVI